MRLSDAIQSLLDATIADGRSLRTVEGYRGDLSELLAFVGDREADQVTVNDLRAFIAHLRTRPSRYPSHEYRAEVPGGLAAASVAGYVRSVKRLFHFLADEDVIAVNPAQRIRVPKLGRSEPKAVDMADIERLLAVTSGEDPEQVRDRLIVLFLADTGCRLGGLVGLRLGDLDFDRRLARVTEKGNKTRWAPFSEPTKAALQAWLAVRPSIADDHVLVAIGNRGGGRALTAEGVRMVLRRLGQRAGVRGRVNPHSFRHAFAREYLMAGGDLATLADILGHSSVTVTWSFYAIFTGAELSRQHERYSPIARRGREESTIDH